MAATKSNHAKIAAELIDILGGKFPGIEVHVVNTAHDVCTDEPASAAWIAWLRDEGDDD